MAKIQVTESELKQIIRESVESELNELFGKQARKQKQLAAAKAKGNGKPNVAPGSVTNGKPQQPKPKKAPGKIGKFFRDVRDANDKIRRASTTQQQIGLDNMVNRF